MNFIEDLDKNIKTLSIQDWKNLLSTELAFVFTTKTYDVNPNYLYRARSNIDGNNKPIDLFKNVDELWAPPSKFINRDGRCNIKGQSILYCATSPTTTLFEIKPNYGEDVTIIDYDVIQKIKNLSVIGYKEIILIDDYYKAIFGEHLINSTRDSIILDGLLSAIFKSSHSKEYPIYNLTNAIFQIFTDEPQNDLVPDLLKLPKCNGLIYPSIATDKLLGINIAMDPDAVKEILRPYAAYKLKVKDKLDEHHYIIARTHVTENINALGEMSWIELDVPIVEQITDLPIE